MELHTLDQLFFVTQAHDGAVFQPSGDFKALRQGFFFDDQGMITGGKEGRGQATEHAFAVVMDMAHLAMHDFMAADNHAAKCLANGLMA